MGAVTLACILVHGGLFATEERQEFTSGAARSRLRGRYDLIPKAAMDALARRLEIGTKYGENNWRLGGEDFRKATVGHLINHLFDYMENGNKNDANTDAILCNAAFLCQYEEDAPYRGVADYLSIKTEDPAS
jgi:dATP/dGTP diphosphohydrolase, N-terminal